MIARRSGRYSPLLAILFVSAVGFAVNTFVTVEFDRRAAYQDWETLFGSDPNWYLPRLTDGTYSSKRHPLLHVFVHVPARAIAGFVSGVTGTDEGWLRRQVVLLASPAASAAKTALLLAMCLALGLRLPVSILIALLDMASLSRLVFGSIPESLGATALALTWMLYLTARALLDDANATFRRTAWFACGLFAIGVTLTNVVPFAIVLVAVLVGRGLEWRSAVIRSLGIAGLLLLTVGILHLASQVLVQPDPQERAAPITAPGPANPPVAGPPAPLGNITPFVQLRPMALLRQLPLVTAATFLGPPPIVGPAPPPAQNPQGRVKLRVPTTELTGEWLWCLAVVSVALGVALVAARRTPVSLRPLLLAVAAILGFNLALFSVWGSETIFIFTLHWQPCLLVLFALGGLGSTRLTSAAVTVYAALLAMEVVWNARFLQLAWGAL